MNNNSAAKKKKKSEPIKQAEERIAKIKSALEQLGLMRPGSVSRQYRNPKERKTPFYHINYTHLMKSRTEYLLKENVKAIRTEMANFKRFRKLVIQWTDAALKLSRLKTSLGLHSDQS